MAVKVSNLVLSKIAGADNKWHARWAAPTGKVTKVYRKSKTKSRSSVTKDRSAVTDEYRVTWAYDVLDVNGKTRRVTKSATTVKSTNDTFDVPDNAIKVYVTVAPVAKEYTYYTRSVNSKGKASYEEHSAKWYTGAGATKNASTGVGTPDAPEIDDLDINGRTITVKVASDDALHAKYVLYVFVNGSQVSALSQSTTEDSATFIVRDCRFSAKYSFQASIVNESGKESPRSAKSADVLVVPDSPKAAPTVVAGEDGAWVTCSENPPNASKWTVQYVSASSREAALGLFESSPESAEATANRFVLADVEANKSYYFRYKVGNDTGDCAQWSPVSSQAFIYGTRPDRPSAYNEKGAYLNTETARLWWVHNSKDGSVQTGAKVTYKIGDGEAATQTLQGDATSLELPLEGIEDGVEVTWSVETKGVSPTWSEPSESVTFKVWEQPVVIVGVSELVDRYPIALTIDPSAPNQTPLIIDVEVLTVAPHQMMRPDGSEVQVQAGEIVWSHHATSPPDPLELSVQAGEMVLTDGQEYAVRAVCVMSSGITCENSATFAYDVDEAAFSVGADLSRPDGRSVEIVPYAVYPSADGSVNYAESVTLSIFRMETDGSLTALVRNMPNDGTYSFTDAHAALGQQGYRIFAVDSETGLVTWDDLEAEFAGTPSLVFSWNDMSDGVEPAESLGVSLESNVLELAYNLSVNEDHSPDMDGVEYIGRKHPVGAYGTQLGETARYSAEIPKTDTDTIKAARRLANAMTDVFVRDPMGSAYYAMAKVSMSSDSESRSVSVSIDVTRTDRTDGCVVL